MSRSGYSEDCDNDWAMICYRGAVKSAIRGARGQAFLKEMLAALDAMPMKRLISDELEGTDRLSLSHWGIVQIEAVCAIGALGKARGVAMDAIDAHDPPQVSGAFNIAESLAREIVYENDEGAGYWSKETPEQRFARMRAWVVAALSQHNHTGGK